MNLFKFFKRKPEPKPIRHYRPEMTADCKDILSGPILPDRQSKIDKANDLDEYITQIGDDRRN